MSKHESRPLAVIEGASPVRLWGLTGSERLERQLRSIGVELCRGGADTLPPDACVIVLRGDCLYDVRVLKGLVAAPHTLLQVDAGERSFIAAAHVTAAQAAQASEALRGARAPAAVAGAECVPLDRVARGYDEALRKLDRPFVLPVTAENREGLEELTFTGAYKGVTDLVTKWVWPVPARRVTRLCVRLGITPNQVTMTGLVLAIAAGVLFAYGEFFWGLVLGWVMTFLDTVDGKLARVTVTSTQFGNIFDHGIDLIHPPLWYIAWGIGLGTERDEVSGVPLATLYVAILAGYIGGRLCEGAFQLWIARFSMFVWRPFDSFFRLIVARRNPCMILLTAGWLAGRPDLGLLAVVAWTVVSAVVLFVRVLMAAGVKLASGSVSSWLGEIGSTISEHTLAVRVFTHAAPRSGAARGHRA